MFIRLNNKNIVFSRGFFILFSSLFLVILYNINAFIVRFYINSDAGITAFKSLGLVFSEVLFAVIVLVGFLSIFVFSKILLRAWVYIFIAISSIFYFFIFKYKIFISDLLIGAIFESDIKEVEGVFSFWIFPWFFVFAIVPIYFLSRKIKIAEYQGSTLITKFWSFCKDAILLGSVCLIIVTLIAIINPNVIKGRYVKKNALAGYMPFNYVAGFYQYFVLFHKGRNLVITDISKQYKFFVNNQETFNKDMNIILVIGESARADHQSLNGYKRETNPLLAKVKNLTSFPNVYSCGTLSRVSVNCILSYKNMADFKFPATESNIISVFKSLGFYTSFLSSQTMYDSGANFFYLASKDADKIVFSNGIREKVPSSSEIYDEYLFHFIKEIQDVPRNKKFIVLYLVGSHTPYHTRYPENFAYFTPDKEGNEGLINSYDNTIRYTDYFLNELISQFKDSNTLLYYVADHGESLGENGIYLHGAKRDSAPKEQINVVQFVWASDKMVKNLGKKYSNIVAKKDAMLSHDNVFHTLLDCIGVSSTIINQKNSLCSPTYNK